jgi:hypothetical protein
MASHAPAPVSPAIVRRGSTLILPAPAPGQPVILPPPCVRCGAPADGKSVEKTYSWHHPAIYLTILAGVLIYVIVAVIVRKMMRVRVPLCARHAQRRSIGVTLAWVLPLIGIADAFILSQFNGVDGGVVALITIALILAGIIIWTVVGMPIRPRFIDQAKGEFTGFCPAYLEPFPEWVQTVATVPSQPGAPPPPPPIS